MLPIAGYADRLSVRPGEKIGFKISSQHEGTYDARLVRIICADANPNGPGILEDAVSSSIEGAYNCHAQPIHLGSYGVVEKDIDLSSGKGLTFIATIWPTMPEAKRRHGVLAAYDPNTRVGFALAVGEDGSAEAILGSLRVKTRVPMENRQWYRVVASYDAARQSLSVAQVRLQRGKVAGKWTEAQMKVEAAGGELPPASMPWHIGALGGHPVRGHFNGKIEAPIMLAGPVPTDGVEAVMSGGSAAAGLIARWDFTRDFDSTRISDIGPKGAHGEVVNLPARAMKGANWMGGEMCFRHAPDQYGAIHFHDDDLYDCGWKTDFTWEVPAGTRSGIYAVRVKAGDDEENIPFIVLPPRGERTADVCVLVSTYTYTVYHNHARPEARTKWWRELWETQAREWTGAYPANAYDHPEYGYSTYNDHTDGSGICHASWLRPMLTMRSGYITYPDEKIRGSGLRHFPADTHLIAWLEKQGYSYDLITDDELDKDGVSAIKDYPVVMTGSHPEYHTPAMIDALEAYRDGGGRFMYLGGNGFYWKVACHKTLPSVIEIRRGEGGIRAWAAEPGEYYNAFDGEYGGLWRRNGRAPQNLCGVGFTAQGNFVGNHYRVLPEARGSRAGWILEGVSDDTFGGYGLSGHGAAGFELDRTDVRLGTPTHAVVLARSEGHEPEAPWVLVPEEQLTHLTTIPGKRPKDLIHADLTFFEAPNNGAVFSTGSITFCGSLPHNNFDNDVSRIIKNVLDRFLDRNARFEMPEEVA
ncbi:MAG: N,N-dimethylformamidase beta subunit family domain-containing protein [Hyphomicrobiaceae bacterium]